MQMIAVNKPVILAQNPMRLCPAERGKALRHYEDQNGGNRYDCPRK